MGLTKAQLEALNISSFPDNTSELITPEILRTYNSASIANTVNQDTYTTDSASFDSRIDSIVTGTGFVTTSSFNAYTSSNDSKVNSLINATSSYANSASVAVVNNAQQAQINSLIAATGSYSTSSVSLTSLNAYTASNDTKWNNLAAQSGSWITESETGSFATSAITASSLITASVVGQTLTFTKGDASTFNVTLPTGSGGGTADLTSLNAFTASQLTINTGYNTYTSSTNGRLTNIESTTASLLIETQNLELFSASALSSISQLNASSASQQISINALNVFTASQSTASIDNSIANLNQFTSSANGRLTNLELTSASLLVETQNLELFSASALVSISNLNANTASQQSQINSLINATASYANSASVALVDANQQSQINALIAVTGSFLTSSADITQLNAFTASQLTINSGYNTFTQSADSRLDNLENTTASLNNSVSNLNAFTSSQETYNTNNNTKWSNLGGQSGSWVSASITGSSLVDIFNTIVDYQFTYTKGDGTQQTVTLNAPAQTDITALNAFTASQLDINSGYNTFTQSANTQLSNLASSQSIDNAKWNTLGGQSGSWITESETGSFARYDVSNPWSADQTFTNITAVSASFTYVKTIFETASVIYSSGSNVFGDAIDDTQTLNGTVIVSGSQQTTGSIIATDNIRSNNYLIGINGVQTNLIVTPAGAGDVTIDTTFGNGEIYLNPYSVVSISNNLNITGSLTASLQEGYVWAGDGSNKTSLVATSSFVSSTLTGSFVTTASFNQYTQSNDQRVSSLEINSASVNTSISALNQFTASQSTASLVTSIDNLNQFSASTLVSLSNLNSTTQSLNTSVSNLNQATSSLFGSASLALVTASASGNTITFTKGNTSTFSVTVDTGSAATTIFEVVYTGENITKGDPLYISGSQGANPTVFKADASNPAKMPVTFVANETIGVNNTTNAIVLGLIEGIDLTGYIAGQSIYVAEGGGWSASLPSGSNSITQLLGVVTKGGSGGKGLVLNPGPATLPGLDTGKMWVGNGNNQPIEITTASFASSASFNAYTSSNDAKVNSLIAATGSYATTGSNVFTGTQIISGSDNASATFSKNSNYIQTVNVNSVLDAFGQIYANTSSVAGQYIGIYDNPNFNVDVEHAIEVRATGVSFNDWDNGTTFGFVPYMTIAPNVGDNPAPTFTRGIEVTGSTNIAELTASLQEGYVWVGNSTGKTTTVATSSFVSSTLTGSFATTGSNTFVGNQIISGTFLQSGSNSLPGGPNGATVGTHIQNRVLISDAPGAITPRLYISGSDGAYTEMGRGFITQDTSKVPGLGAFIYTAGPTDALSVNTVASITPDYSTDVELQMFASTSSIGLADWDNGSTFSYVPFMELAPNNGDNPPVNFKRSVAVTGSLSVTGSASITGSTDITGSLRATGELKFAVGGNKPFGTITANDTPYTLTNSLITPDSIIMLTLKTFSGGGGNPTLYIGSQTTGSAQIEFTNDSSTFTFNYMIINPA